MGLNHIYFGSGKGKTTAALGLALRAAGCGMTVLIVQFLKSSDTSELHSLTEIDGITVLRSDKRFGFTFNMTDEEKAELTEVNNDLLRQAQTSLLSGKTGMLILDEFLDAYNLGFVDKALADDTALRHYDNSELIITGRTPPEHYIALYDYVSEICSVKHPFDKGIPARKGIEY